MKKNKDVKDLVEEEVDKIFNKVVTYRDKNHPGRVIVLFLSDGHVESYDFFDNTFTALVRVTIREDLKIKRLPNISSLLSAYYDHAIIYAEERDIYSRIAGDKSGVTYFLADDEWNCVEVTENGYNLVKKPDYIFLKNQNVAEQVVPKGNGNLLKLLRPFVNLKCDDFLLFAIHLVQNFFPNSSHFIGVISSSHGTGKSTLSKLFRELVSPAKASQAILPKNPEELKNHLANNVVVVFDNSEKIGDELSDILCGATTGTAMTKRTLYTTADETIITFKNSILINGIDIVPRKKDLLERSLLFELQHISETKRKTDTKFWEEFNKNKPYILGAIFMTLSKAIHIRKNLKLTKTHRMSDAYTDMVAIAKALNVDKNKFIEIFNNNKKILEEINSDEDYFVACIVDYMDSRKNRKIELTMTNFYKEIINCKYINNKYMPKSASAFSRKLKNEESALRLAGYKFFIQPKKDATYILLEKIPEREKN